GGLITLQDAALRVVLDNKKPESLPAGGFYLIDPLGNLVLYFGPGINPRDMVDDIKRLLKLSRIG
ncbi:MAG: cytochrome oxidase assembly protein, partial [Gammaproteobacteria bacterium]|nr:cytochrome oxidase assembly protein [Gammaproteobacteria bacterium]